MIFVHLGCPEVHLREEIIGLVEERTRAFPMPKIFAYIGIEAVSFPPCIFVVPYM
jgi:hypothetical protein